MLFSINPTLSPADVIDLLKTTAEDLGPLGRDHSYGWGRIDFGRAAAAAQATLQILEANTTTDGLTVSMIHRPGITYSLWKASQLVTPEWLPVPDAILSTNVNLIRLTDPNPTSGWGFYRVGLEAL